MTTQATMHVKERSEAIQRAQRALKALGAHPRSSKKELGHAREHVNACYSHASGEHVWNAVAQVEAMQAYADIMALVPRWYRQAVRRTACDRLLPATARELDDLRRGLTALADELGY